MNKYKIKNLDALKIEQKYYGLSQEWYKDEFQIKAGCGATVAATIISYYSQKENIKDLKISDVLPLMETLWNYLLPIRNRGLNSTKLFYEGIEKFFRDRNIEIKYDYLNILYDNKLPIENVVNFIKEALNKDRPLAFLNLCNGEEVNLDKWHWVTVIEIFEEDNNYFLNILDDKEIKKINLNLWYNTITNDGGFVTFYK